MFSHLVQSGNDTFVWRHTDVVKTKPVFYKTTMTDWRWAKILFYKNDKHKTAIEIACYINPAYIFYILQTLAIIPKLDSKCECMYKKTLRSICQEKKQTYINTDTIFFYAVWAQTRFLNTFNIIFMRTSCYRDSSSLKL